MNITSYRIPVKVFTGPETPSNELRTLAVLNNIRQHLYLAANITYQHFYQQLSSQHPVQVKLYSDFNYYQQEDTKAWEKLNNAKLCITNPLATQQEKTQSETAFKELPAYIRELRKQAKQAIYNFAREDSFIKILSEKFADYIPLNVMQYSMAKVLQELYTDYSEIQKSEGLQPLRVYTKNFPICFGWNDNIKYSFEWLADKKDTGPTARFYIFKWFGDETLSMKCRIGKGLPELALILNKIQAGDISYHNCGDPSIHFAGKDKWVLQFAYKEDAEIKVPANDNIIAMGIDLGYKVPIAWALNDAAGTSDELGDIDEIKEKRKKLQQDYSRLIAAMKQTHKGRGRARKSAILKKRANDERRFFNTLNSQWASELVGIAIEHNVSVIKIEDLDFEKTRDRTKKIARTINLQLTQRKIQKIRLSRFDHLLTMFRNWSYGDLLRRIEKEAMDNNIIVARVNPSYTSKQCYRCTENEGTRTKQEHLRFTSKQQQACRYAKEGKCALIPYTEQEIARQKKGAGKKRDGQQDKPIYTYYLLADNNAARRIARAVTYHIKNDKP